MATLENARHGTTRSAPQLRYWTGGRGATPVLLIMGFGMRGRVWRPQIQDLGKDHQLAWYDHRGVGESERGRAKRWRMEDMAADALRVMDSVGWGSAHVVGVSMGGMIAQHVALRAEARVRSLTLIATHAGGPFAGMPTPKGARQFLSSFTAKEPGQKVQALRELLYPPAFLAEVDPASLGERMRDQMGQPAPRPVLLAQLEAVWRHRTGARLEGLEVPALIVKPTQDLLVRPENSDELKRRLAHARFLELEDAGHGAIFQSAKPINAAIRRLVSDVEATRLVQSQPTIQA
ncbi:MAG: alpha/beta hydrolase [Myxococcota bacterium]